MLICIFVVKWWVLEVIPKPSHIIIKIHDTKSGVYDHLSYQTYILASQVLWLFIKIWRDQHAKAMSQPTDPSYESSLMSSHKPNTQILAQFPSLTPLISSNISRVNAKMSRQWCLTTYIVFKVFFSCPIDRFFGYPILAGIKYICQVFLSKP